MSEETRARIIAAGLKCFALYGYDGSTNNDIAAEAGVTSGALYHYFESKPNLFDAVLREQQDRVLQGFEEAAAAVDGTVAKLCAVLDRAVELNAEDEHLAHFVAVAPIEIDRHDELRAATSRHPMPTATGAIADFFARLVTEGQEKGEVDPTIDTAAIVLMLSAATQGLAQLAGLMRDPVSHKGAIEAFEQLVRGQLFRSPAQRVGGRRRKAG